MTTTMMMMMMELVLVLLVVEVVVITSLPSDLKREHPRGVVCGAFWRVPMKMKIADRS